ncbi:MAG TPA: NAD(P)H-dependent oxidoreductase [Flavisolibacter sp.]|jgi:NAD(P)H-dependent FMN reductase|nr:NAD(P)H-dependent oxidoreductase [Flavisolibacter sp.]
MRIEIVSGSPRLKSLTKRVAVYLYRELLQLGDVEVGLIDVRKYTQPPVETVITSVENAPAHLRELSSRIFAADAFILVTPEYNGSYSPAMKNLLDHFPKQQHKAFGIVTASTGALGGMRAAMQLQKLVFALFGIGSPHMLLVPEVDKKFTDKAELADQHFSTPIRHFLKEFLWLAHAVAYAAEKEFALAETGR